MTIFRLLVFIVFIIPAQVFSQGVQFGVDWKIPESTAEQQSELNHFFNSGIRIVQIEGVVDESTIQLIQENGLEIWVSSGVKYLRPSDYSDRQNLMDKLTDPLFYYRNNGIKIARYTLFEHPLQTSEFVAELPSFLSNVNGIYSGTVDMLYSTAIENTTTNGLSLGITISSFDTVFVNSINFEEIGYLKVLNSSFTPNSARKLREVLLRDDFNNKLWLFETDILTTLESNPELEKVIKGFSDRKNAVVALGPEIAEEDSLVVITIAILILITLFIAIFTTNASYQRSIIRYLMTHNFFINDVMMKRTRLTGAIPLAWILSLLFGLLLTWITIDSVFNDVTIDMLAFHHPQFGSVLASGITSTILMIAFGLFLAQVVSLLWVIDSTFNKASIAQITQILLIPHQLVIPITIVASLFYLNSNSPLILITALGFFVIILLLSIPLTCIDILSQSQGKKGINWIVGPVLFIITLIATVVYTLNYTTIPDTINLILALI
jgi:hypothetical protein